jgi:hypothetical protein
METPITKTNAFTILTLFVRLAAILGFVWFVHSALGVLFGLESISVGDWAAKFLLGAVFGALLIFGLLWLFADWVARVSLARRDGMVFDSSMSAEDWSCVGFSVIGVFFVVKHAIGVAQQIVYAIVAALAYPDAQNENLWLDGVLSATYELIGVALGAVLMLRARGLVGLLHRLRSAGQPTPTTRAPDEPN